MAAQMTLWRILPPISIGIMEKSDAMTILPISAPMPAAKKSPRALRRPCRGIGQRETPPAVFSEGRFPRSAGPHLAGQLRDLRCLPLLFGDRHPCGSHQTGPKGPADPSPADCIDGRLT